MTNEDLKAAVDEIKNTYGYQQDLEAYNSANKNFFGMNKDRPKKSNGLLLVEAAQILLDLQENDGLKRVWKRGEGQTTKAVELAKDTKAYLIVRDHKAAQRLSAENPELRFPITFEELIQTKMKGSYVREIVIDDVEDLKTMLLGMITAGLNVTLPTPPKGQIDAT